MWKALIVLTMSYTYLYFLPIILFTLISASNIQKVITRRYWQICRKNMQWNRRDKQLVSMVSWKSSVKCFLCHKVLIHWLLIFSPFLYVTDLALQFFYRASLFCDAFIFTSLSIALFIFTVVPLCILSQNALILCFYGNFSFQSDQIRSVAQSCPTLCDPMNRSTPGLPVHHQHPEFTQTHVHRVSDAIQPSHPLSSPSPPAPDPSWHQSLFQWINSSHEVAKVLDFQL